MCGTDWAGGEDPEVVVGLLRVERKLRLPTQYQQLREVGENLERRDFKVTRH